MYIQPKRSMLTMFDVKGKGWGPNLSSSDCAIELSSKQNNGAVISSGSNNNLSNANPMYACFLCIRNFLRDE